MSNFSTEGYAPHVPRHISPATADEYTLLSMVRDTLQNGTNPTRGNLAFGLLVEKLAVPAPDLPLDPKPYSWSGVPWERSGDPDALDPIYGTVEFMPRFGYAQEQESYR